MRHRAWVTACALLGGCARPPAPASEPPDLVDALAAHAIPLTTTDPEADLDDLAALAALFGDARVVSLGEATHGTREFSLLKHRLIRYLVEVHGFTAVGIEANFAETLALDAWVHGGVGDPGEALHAIGYWFQDNEELLALIRWMRAHNAAAPPERQVSLYGLDLQYSAPVSLVPALQYLADVDPDHPVELAALAALLNAFDGNRFDTAMYAHLPEETHARVAAALGRASDQLAANEDAYIARSSREAWLLARRHLRVATQIEGSVRRHDMSRFALRDYALAENVSALLAEDGPQAKMAVWAHNGHVNLRYNAGPDSWPSMGSYLEEALGPAHVALGFAFGGGAFRAVSDGAYVAITPPPPPPDSLDATLARLDLPQFVVDLAHLPEGIARTWLDGELQTQESDAAYGGQPKAITPRAYYDALVFVRQSTPAHTRAIPRPPDPIPIHPTLDDPDFAQSGPLSGWWMSAADRVLGFTAERDAGAARLSRDASAPWGSGELLQRLDAAPLRGRRLTVVARMRAEVSGIGEGAQIFAYAAGPRGGQFGMPVALGQATMFEHPVTEPDWQTRAIALDVPSSAETVTIGFALTGGGRAWIDDIALTLDPPE